MPRNCKSRHAHISVIADSHAASSGSGDTAVSTTCTPSPAIGQRPHQGLSHFGTIEPPYGCRGIQELLRGHPRGRAACRARAQKVAAVGERRKGLFIGYYCSLYSCTGSVVPRWPWRRLLRCLGYTVWTPHLRVTHVTNTPLAFHSALAQYIKTREVISYNFTNRNPRTSSEVPALQPSAVYLELAWPRARCRLHQLLVRTSSPTSARQTYRPRTFAELPRGRGSSAYLPLRTAPPRSRPLRPPSDPPPPPPQAPARVTDSLP